MNNRRWTEHGQSPWRLFWLGVNATAAATWCGVCVLDLALTVVGTVAHSATGATIGLLIGLGWLVGAIRSVRAERYFPGGLFWFAISATLGAAGSLLAAAALDLTQRTEALDRDGLAALRLALVCGLIWFGASMWRAASLASRVKGKGF